MRLSLLLKGKGRGFIWPLLGVTILLSAMFAFIVQPTGAATSSLVATLAVDTDIGYYGSTVRYTVSLINLTQPGAQPVDFDVFFTPPAANGTPGTEVQLNVPGGGANRLHLNVGDSITYDYNNLPPQNGSSLTQILALNNNVITAEAQCRIAGTYVNGDTATGTQTVHTHIIWPSTTVTISSNPVGPVAAGTAVTLTVTETNNTVGPLDTDHPQSTDISNPSVALTDNLGSPTITLTNLSGTFTGVDGDIPNVLDGSDTGQPLPASGADNETWTWVIPNMVINANTIFTANGDGIDHLGNHVNFNTVRGKTPGDTNERASVTVNTESKCKIKADLRITKTSNPCVVMPGNQITYTITVTNGGPSNATGVVVNDVLPGEVIYVSSTPSQGNANESGGTVTWNVGNLSNGGSATLTIVVEVNPSLATIMSSSEVNAECAQCSKPPLRVKDEKVIINKASVKANECDLNPFNNSAKTNTKVSKSNLKVIKTDELPKCKTCGGATVRADTIHYTVIITNAFEFSVSGLTFSDTPDANSTLVAGSVTTTSGSVAQGNTAGDTSVLVNLDPLGAGGQVTITFNVTINKTWHNKITRISNQGVLTDANGLTWQSDDPDTREVGDPTVTKLDDHSGLIFQ
jgi:uncharacterized repeat protein (TIGR01451 family)